MKHSAVLIILGFLCLQSCFIGSDIYEREVNEYFWLHGDVGSKNTYLGTIDEGTHFSDQFLGPIERIGWDEKFIILKDKSGDFYIQPIDKEKKIEKVKSDLIGPLLKEEFEKQRQILQIDEKLGFEIKY